MFFRQRSEHPWCTPFGMLNSHMPAQSHIPLTLLRDIFLNCRRSALP